MATQQSPSSYGPEYEQLLLRAADWLQRNPEYTVQFAEAKISASVQARFRAYVRALKDSSDRPDLTAIASHMSTRLAGGALVFFKREDSVDAIAIREALGLEPGFADGSTSGVLAPQSSHADALDRLKRLRASK